MEIITTVGELRDALEPGRLAGRTIGFVPTMGFLHEGHLSLIRESVTQSDVTVVSIFVNPTQFGPREDLDSYPRDAAGDARLCQDAGVDVLFMPTVEEVYPPGNRTGVEPGPLAEPLCGSFRPGHFRGVATVVAKLFNMVQPHRAWFGRKDYQQALVIQRMVRDLHVPVEVIALPTIREADGLAVSSRNAHLSPEARSRAACLSRGLFAALDAFRRGERDSERLLAIARAYLGETDSIQYLELVHAETLERIAGTVDAPAVMCTAAFIGGTRLIDNVLLSGSSDA